MPKASARLADLAADAAHAEHAERLAGKFGALKLFAVPLARRHRGVGLRHLARQAQNHRERQLRRGNRVAARRVHHHHAALRGGFHVHVVHAHARAADDAQLRRGLDDLARHLGFGPHDHRRDVGDQRQQFGFGQPLRQHDHLKFRAAVAAGRCPLGEIGSQTSTFIGAHSLGKPHPLASNPQPLSQRIRILRLTRLRHKVRVRILELRRFYVRDD